MFESDFRSLHGAIVLHRRLFLLFVFTYIAIKMTALIFSSANVLFNFLAFFLATADGVTKFDTWLFLRTWHTLIDI